LEESQKQTLFRFVNELNDSATVDQWEKVIADIKEYSVAKQQEELKVVHEKLRLKDEEIAKLLQMRQDTETEVQELTASLFQVTNFALKNCFSMGKP
jgi:Rab-3A-interacting protein